MGTEIVASKQFPYPEPADSALYDVKLVVHCPIGHSQSIAAMILVFKEYSDP
jgi:rhodanese-related sulfurtransferase